MNFVDDYLKIRRVHNEYRPGNKDFDNLNLMKLIMCLPGSRGL